MRAYSYECVVSSKLLVELKKKKNRCEHDFISLVQLWNLHNQLSSRHRRYAQPQFCSWSEGSALLNRAAAGFCCNKER